MSDDEGEFETIDLDTIELTKKEKRDGREALKKFCDSLIKEKGLTPGQSCEVKLFGSRFIASYDGKNIVFRRIWDEVEENQFSTDGV